MSGPDVAFSFQSLLGQSGGALALAYGAGAASGWAFAIRTAFRSVKRQVDEQREAHDRQIREMREAHDRHINELNEQCKRDREDCDRRIAHLEAWVKEQGDRYTSGLERQLAQARESAQSMTGRFEGGRKTSID